MVESTVNLLVAIKRRHEGNALQGNPINDSAFKTFGVIRSSTVSALLQLVKCQIDRMGKKCNYTKLAMCLISCSEVISSAKWAWRLGMSMRSSLKTRNCCRCLQGGWTWEMEWMQNNFLWNKVLTPAESLHPAWWMGSQSKSGHHVSALACCKMRGSCDWNVIHARLGDLFGI